MNASFNPPSNERSGRTRQIAVIVMLALFLTAVVLLGKGRGWKTRIVRALVPAKHAIQQNASQVLAASWANDTVRFEQVALPVTNRTNLTCVQVGPDHQLYAGVDDGHILRYPILAGGLLGAPRPILSLREKDGPRLLTGFCFDPLATTDNPILWVSHGYRAFTGAEDWSGSISRLSGRDLEIVEDVVIHLPRSIRDHLNNQPVFGPDGALYFPQGSNTAMGAPDANWGGRPEHLLSATILRLDIKLLNPGAPLDVRTPDGGGTYDPFAPGAPLTIFATGVRNAFDLVWASNGRLYVPTNGSSAGGSTPPGPGAPALNNLPGDENDWLFRVTPGKYYGHPNPRQGHYVLNGGNPAGATGSAIIPQYPIGTVPDLDWEAAAYDFGRHASANGIIEYHGPAFGGRLDKKLLICRYNVGSDVICLGLDAAGNVSSAVAGIPGLGGFANPLDLAEDQTSGNLYVAEYGGRRITLLRPATTSSSPTPTMAPAKSATTLARANPNAGLTSSAGSSPPNRGTAGKIAHGKTLFGTSCFVCHGPTGAGVPGLGANLRSSRFINSHTDDQLTAFVKAGRQPTDPDSVLHLMMPPSGGNPSLDDKALQDIVAFLRTLQDQLTLRR